MIKGWTHFSVMCIGLHNRGSKHFSIGEIILGDIFTGYLFKISYNKKITYFDLFYTRHFINKWKTRKLVKKDLNNYFETELRHSKEIDDKVFNNKEHKDE